MSAGEDLDLVSASDWANRFRSLCRCVETAPEGAFAEAKAMRDYVNDAACAIQKGLLDGGVNASIMHEMDELKAAIYAYIRKSNPDRIVFSTIEYWGANIDGPEGPAMRARVEGALQAFSPTNVQIAITKGDL